MEEHLNSFDPFRSRENKDQNNLDVLKNLQESYS